MSHVDSTRKIFETSVQPEKRRTRWIQLIDIHDIRINKVLCTWASSRRRLEMLLSITRNLDSRGTRGTLLYDEGGVGFRLILIYVPHHEQLYCIFVIEERPM